MKKQYFLYLLLSFIAGIVFFTGLIPTRAQEQDNPPNNLLDPLRKGTGELEDVEPEMSASKVIIEQQLKRFLAVIAAMNEAEIQSLNSGAVSMPDAMLKALKNQAMTPDEYQEISDAIYFANITLREQSMQLMPEADDAAFEKVLDAHQDISEVDKQAMRESRAKKQGWYKGTKSAPLANLELVDRYWKEINEGPRQDIRYYDDFLPTQKPLSGK
ncbi:MAG: hypothetical protein Q8O30_02000 [Candidatus Omnitrophota bacterium]|nr:hypothetical protein [Candidatus Omnitrophota bacterium]